MTASSTAALTNTTPSTDQAMTTIGVTGLRPRWSVTPWGGVLAWNLADEAERAHGDASTLDWYVAADDRWHVPAQEPTVRQRRIDGAPVLETRVRVPDGDVVQRVWAVPEQGGMVVVEFENSSPLPIAIALVGSNVITERPTSDVPIQGIDLPESAIVLPLGHHATVRVLLPATSASKRWVPVPPPLSVARGWTTVIERASRFVVPDETLVDAATAARCDLLLEGPVESDDAVGFLLDVAELVRCGDDAEPWLVEIVDPAERTARIARSAGHGNDRNEALDALRAARTVARAAGDDRAATDLARIVTDLASGAGSGRRRFARSSRSTDGGEATVDEAPSESSSTSFAELRRSSSVGRFVRSIERRVVEPNASGGGAALLPGGIPTGWLGANFEVHGVPSGGDSTVSFAVRWHGERPAVLWDQHGPAVRLTSPTVDPSWATIESSGETLWAAPAVVASTRSSLLVTAVADETDDGTTPGPPRSPSPRSGTGILSVESDGGSFA